MPDYTDLVRSLLRAGSEAAPSPLDEFVVAGLASHGPESPDWIWEPIIRRQHLNLIEAKGSVGKSTLAVAISLHVGNGRAPFGTVAGCGRTLYIARQDRPGEIRYRTQIFEGLDIDCIRPWPAPGFVLNDEGLRRLAAMIDANDIVHVVFDPVKAFFPAAIRQEFDNIGLNRLFDDLRVVAEQTNVAMTLIRHFSRMPKGRPITDLGAGGEEWRNSARTQLVMLPHPDSQRYPRFAGVFPARGSINAPPGAPFGFDIRQGQFVWVPPHAFPLDTYCEHYEAVAQHYGRQEDYQESRRSGRPSVAVQAAIDAIREMFTDGRTMPYRSWLNEMARLGHAERTAKRARGELKSAGFEYRAGQVGFFTESDPPATPPPWAGLEDDLSIFEEGGDDAM